MKRFRKITERFNLKTTGKWFVLATLVGVVAGCGAIAFQVLLQTIQFLTLVYFAGFNPVDAAGEHHLFSHVDSIFHPWMMVAMMAIGGLISGWLVFRFAPETAGHGTDAAIEAFHMKRGRIRPIAPLIKALSSAITLGTGGSGGREGPIAQIGAGFGSFLATRLHLSDRDRRILLAAGMSAGVGSIFRAPLAAALFAGEILYRDADLDSDVIVPAAMSSIVGFSVYSLSLPPETRFQPLFGDALQFNLGSYWELLAYTILAFVLTIAAYVFVQFFYGTHNLFEKIKIPQPLKPCLGAGLAGVLGIGIYQMLGSDDFLLGTLSTGYGSLQQALEASQSVAVSTLFLVVVVKMITTSLTISSGGSGGVFGPAMVIGGCLGAAVGKIGNEISPEIVQQPGAFAIVGMAGFFAGAANAPFSTIIMVSEMTGDYQLLLPTMWVSTLCFLLCSRTTLYRKQLPSRLESPAHRGDFVVDVLEGIKVTDVYQRHRQLIKIPESMNLKGIVHTLAMTTQRYFPVVDDEDRLVGIFSAEDVRSYLYDEDIWELAVARDVMVTNIIFVHPDDDLNTALRKFTVLNVDELPVVEPSETSVLLGMLRRREAIAAYNRRLMEHKQQQDEAID